MRNLFFLFFLLAACKSKNIKFDNPQAGQKPAPIKVVAMVATTKNITDEINVPGTLKAGESVDIHSEISGRIITINFKEGNNIAKGALLVKLNDADLQAQMRKVQIQLKIAEQTEKRQSELLKIQGISQQDYDLSLLQVNNLKADMDIIKTSIAKTEIRSPFNGKIGLRNISEGAYITPSTSITNISQVSQVKLQFNVPEKYGTQLSIGKRINFGIDGEIQTFVAQIIAQEITIDENTRTLAIRAMVLNNHSALIPGAFAKVNISVGQKANAIMVPTLAVLPTGRKKQVFIYKNGIAFATDVITGVRDSSNIQIVSGVNLGDTIITSGLLFIKNGSEVKLNNAGQ